MHAAITIKFYSPFQADPDGPVSDSLEKKSIINWYYKCGFCLLTVASQCKLLHFLT